MLQAHATSSLVLFVELGIKPRAWYVLGMCYSWSYIHNLLCFETNFFLALLKLVLTILLYSPGTYYIAQASLRLMI